MILLVAFLTVMSPAPAPASGDSFALSSEQRQRLAGGDVIFLDVLPPGGDVKGSQGGTAVALVHATAETVWRLLVDYRRHSGLYPRVIRAEVVESDETHAVVRYFLGVGLFSFGFHVKNFADPSNRRVVWRLDSARPNNLFRDSWGYWQIKPVPGGVVLTSAMAARTVLPAFLTRGAERSGLVETLKAVRERAEHAH